MSTLRRGVSFQQLIVFGFGAIFLATSAVWVLLSIREAGLRDALVGLRYSQGEEMADLSKSLAALRRETAKMKSLLESGLERVQEHNEHSSADMLVSSVSSQFERVRVQEGMQVSVSDDRKQVFIWYFSHLRELPEARSPIEMIDVGLSPDPKAPARRAASRTVRRLLSDYERVLVRATQSRGTLVALSQSRSPKGAADTLASAIKRVDEIAAETRTRKAFLDQILRRL